MDPASRLWLKVSEQGAQVVVGLTFALQDGRRKRKGEKNAFFDSEGTLRSFARSHHRSGGGDAAGQQPSFSRDRTSSCFKPSKNCGEVFGSEKVQEHPRIKPWRTAFSKLGISGSKFPSSIESMARRILRGDPFPRINPLVDLYNSVSLKHLVPMGGHDLDTLDGKSLPCDLRRDGSRLRPWAEGKGSPCRKENWSIGMIERCSPEIGYGASVKKIRPPKRQKTFSFPSMSSGRWAGRCGGDHSGTLRSDSKVFWRDPSFQRS